MPYKRNKLSLMIGLLLALVGLYLPAPAFSQEESAVQDLIINGGFEGGFQAADGGDQHADQRIGQQHGVAVCAGHLFGHALCGYDCAENDDGHAAQSTLLSQHLRPLR